jgi:F-type H+-transporting ATPase subunit epsilon
MKLTLVTPEKKYVQNLEVEKVIIPAFRGLITVLPGHAPLVTTLSTGILVYKPKAEAEQKLVVSSGYCEVFPDGVQILAETAESAAEVDRERAQKALTESLEKLNHVKDVGPDEIQRLQKKAARAKARLSL